MYQRTVVSLFLIGFAGQCGCDSILNIVLPGRECGGLLGTACGPGQFCQYPKGTCGAADETGVCTIQPELCTLEFAPVCGCDDTTYSNACDAYSNGVSIVRDGSCEDDDGSMEERICGGIAGFACEEGEWCRFEPGTCGAADQSGVCMVLPEVCSEIFAPVCGCDEETYENECVAGAAGISVLREGACGGPG